MKLQLQRIEGSVGLTLPDELVCRLRLRHRDWIEATANEEGTLTVARSDVDFDKAMKIAEKVMIEYRDTLIAIGND